MAAAGKLNTTTALSHLQRHHPHRAPPTLPSLPTALRAAESAVIAIRCRVRSTPRGTLPLAWPQHCGSPWVKPRESMGAIDFLDAFALVLTTGDSSGIAVDAS
jgi:hypothetical protein